MKIKQLVYIFKKAQVDLNQLTHLFSVHLPTVATMSGQLGQRPQSHRI